MFLNWWLEIRKWQLLVRPYEICSFYKSAQTVLGSLSFGLSTPNRVGEYGMRSAFMKNNNRKNGVLLTLLSSVAQLLITMAVGTFSVVLLQAINKNQVGFQIQHSVLFFIGIFLILLFVLLLAFYFKTTSLLTYFQRFRFLLPALPEKAGLQLITNHLRLEVLFLSILRYMVFALQQVLVWQVFGAGLETYPAFLTVACMYLIMAFVPTIALAELGIRGQVAVWVAGIFTNNYLAIISGTAFVWFLNLFLPALFGTYFLWNLRHRKKDGKE
jgi:hypothetical protein